MKFLTVNEKNEIFLNEDIFKLIKNKKVIPVSIIGQSRIGKSTFLNLLIHGLKYGFENENVVVEEVFKAENTDYGESVTDGIDIFPELIPITYICKLDKITVNSSFFFSIQ